MSEKYEQVKKFYDLGVWSEQRVRDAVAKNWVTMDEFKEITGKNY